MSSRIHFCMLVVSLFSPRLEHSSSTVVVVRREGTASEAVEPRTRTSRPKSVLYEYVLYEFCRVSRETVKTRVPFKCVLCALSSCNTKKYLSLAFVVKQVAKTLHFCTSRDLVEKVESQKSWDLWFKVW